MKTKIVIEIKSNFNKQEVEDNGEKEDVTEEITNAFHNAVYNFIEYELTVDENFEQEIINSMHDDDDFTEKIKSFSDLGNFSISIREESVER